MSLSGPQNQISSYFKLTGSSRLHWFRELYQTYGDTVGMKLAHQQVVLTRDPKVAEEVLKNPQAFRKTSLGYRVLDEIGKDGLFTSDYDKWKDKRPILQPFFTKMHQRLYFDQIQEIIKHHLEDPNLQSEVDLNQFMGEMTMDIALNIFFGYSADKKLIHELLYFSNKLSEVSAKRMKHPLIPSSFPLPFNIVFNKQFNRVQLICRNIIKERRKKTLEDSTDFLGALLKVHQEQPDFISEQAIVHEMITFILAGALTTAHAASWIWYELIKNEGEMKRLIREIDELKDHEINPDKLESFVFIQQVIQETVRLHPAIPVIPRGVSSGGASIGKSHLKKGTEVLIDLYGLNRHPAVFKEGDSFDPSRFEKENYRVFEYMPWGGGIR